MMQNYLIVCIVFYILLLCAEICERYINVGRYKYTIYESMLMALPVALFWPIVVPMYIINKCII